MTACLPSPGEDTSRTPAEQFEVFVAETLATTDTKAEKIAAIVAEFKEWIEAHQAGTAVEIVGGRAAVQTVEAYGLEIGIDALGRATRIETPGLLNRPELTWSVMTIE
jgi:hypothetical protein